MDLDGTGLRQAMQPQFQPTISSWRPVALELPTPSDRARAGSVISIPTGEISESRFDVPTHGTLGPYEAIIDTDAGEIRIDLYNHIAPITVENFVISHDRDTSTAWRFIPWNLDRRSSAVPRSTRLGATPGTTYRRSSIRTHCTMRQERFQCWQGLSMAVRPSLLSPSNRNQSGTPT